MPQTYIRFSRFLTQKELLFYPFVASIIYSENEYLDNLRDVSKSYKCNISQSQWITKLIGELEEWYANTLNCTVIHGSCIRMFGKNILLVGTRKTGKTTLTAYLTHEHNALYLDDDCVYFFVNQFYGFNMPVALRENVDDLSPKSMICSAYDGENINRKLFWPNKCIDKLASMDIILFPKYSAENANTIVEIKSDQVFCNIIKNIRYSPNIEMLFYDICRISENTKLFHILYSSSEEAYRLIHQVI